MHALAVGLATVAPLRILVIGLFFGLLVGAFLMRLYDDFWERIWRVPQCTPGNCYCRLSCACIDMEPEA